MHARTDSIMQRLACLLIPDHGRHSLARDTNTFQGHTTQWDFEIETNNKPTSYIYNNTYNNVAIIRTINSGYPTYNDKTDRDKVCVTYTTF